MDFSGKYVFIRYNPDKYKDKNGKNRNPPFETRINALVSEIKKHKIRIEKEKNDDLVEINHMYYNEL